MARYSALVGRRIEVHYRSSDIVLPAIGTLVADCGKSIFIETQSAQKGVARKCRWEISYQQIVRIGESAMPPAPPPPNPSPSLTPDSEVVVSKP